MLLRIIHPPHPVRQWWKLVNCWLEHCNIVWHMWMYEQFYFLLIYVSLPAVAVVEQLQLDTFWLCYKSTDLDHMISDSKCALIGIGSSETVKGPMSDIGHCSIIILTISLLWCCPLLVTKCTFWLHCVLHTITLSVKFQVNDHHFLYTMSITVFPINTGCVRRQITSAKHTQVLHSDHEWQTVQNTAHIWYFTLPNNTAQWETHHA